MYFGLNWLRLESVKGSMQDKKNAYKNFSQKP